MKKQLDELIAVGKYDNIFPLFSVNDLAKRWGKTVQGIHWLAKNKEGFPKPINEIFESVPYREYYPYYEVLRYERETGKNILSGIKESYE